MNAVRAILNIGRLAVLVPALTGLAITSPVRADHKHRAHVRAGVNIGIGPRVERVWVPPVYEERRRVIHEEPVYETRTRETWCPPEYEDRWVKVDVPPVIERCREPIIDDCGRTVGYRWVEKIVRPARCERQLERVVVREGHYRTISEPVLVRAGCDRVVTERVCVREGYYADAPCDRRFFGLNFAFSR